MVTTDGCETRQQSVLYFNSIWIRAQRVDKMPKKNFLCIIEMLSALGVLVYHYKEADVKLLALLILNKPKPCV